MSKRCKHTRKQFQGSQINQLEKGYSSVHRDLLYKTDVLLYILFANLCDFYTRTHTHTHIHTHTHTLTHTLTYTHTHTHTYTHA